MSDRPARTIRTATGLDGLAAVSHDIGVADRHLRDLRGRQRELIAELHGTVPMVELVGATGMTRQHLHRLARRD